MSENGLSKEDVAWLGKWFESLAQIQNEQLKTLRTINTAIQVVAVIVLLTAILAACSALGVRL